MRESLSHTEKSPPRVASSHVSNAKSLRTVATNYRRTFRKQNPTSIINCKTVQVMERNGTD